MRDYLEARRRARILTCGSVLFLVAAAAGIVTFGLDDSIDRTPAPVRYTDRAAATSELRHWILRLNDPELPSAEAVASLKELGEILDQFPLLRKQIEPGVLRSLQIRKNQHYRGQAYLLLARMKSSRALNWIRDELATPESEVAPLALQALARYLGTSRDAPARDLLWKIARDRKRPDRAEATRLLAIRRDRRVASVVPEMLGSATATEQGAALEAIGRLGLHQYRRQADERTGSTDPFVQDRARRAVERLDSRTR